MRKGVRIGVVLVVALVAMSCSGSDGDDGARRDERAAGSETSGGFAARATAYLERAAASEVEDDASRAKVWRAVARLAIDPDGDEPTELTVDDLDTITERFATFQDTTDFDMIALLNLWYRSSDGERLAPDTRDHIRRLILDFKYWYTDPQPEGVVDERWYWSENHQILFHTIELLAGQAFPDETFTVAGLTGAEHVERATPMIERWIRHRARFGFSEWYSNVYYQEDLEATVALAEFADDADLRTLGAIGTDLALYDVASHTHDGAFGATQGRTYKKDKMTAFDADTWDVSKLVLDDADGGYRSDRGAVFLASATHYRPPAVLAEIVADDGDAPSDADVGGIVERARHSLPLDPLAEVTPDPDAPFEFDFDDPDDLMVWWAMAALTPWQTVVPTTDEMTRYDLWSAELFSDFKPFEPLVKAAPPDTIRQLARSLAPQLNIGLLSEANTYTWRNGDSMLSTVQDFRKGQASQQHHVWQATLSPDAQVFTTHPRTPTEPGVPWHSNSDDWTGNASLPRSAQFRNVNVSIYAPLFPSEDTLQGSYQPYTHAYLPQDHFDEVTQEGRWTFARSGDAYLALYSWRDTGWMSYDPAEVDTNGLTKPFELVASGGPNNVWITEIGHAESHGTFDEFRAAIAANEPVVTPLGDADESTTAFDVEWTSPSVGDVSFGWDSPLVVGGDERSLDDYPRIDSPWASVPFDTERYVIKGGRHTLRLDAAGPTRESSADL